MTRKELIEAILLEYGKLRVYGGKFGETTRELVQDPDGTSRKWMTKAFDRPTKFTDTGAAGKTVKVITQADVEKKSTAWEKRIQAMMGQKKKA